MSMNEKLIQTVHVQILELILEIFHYYIGQWVGWNIGHNIEL